jgi:hypothetical protein
MMRRAFWLLPIAVCLAADPAQEVLDLFTSLAASLSANNASEFMSAFDRRMPGYEKLQGYVNALVGPKLPDDTFLINTENYVDVVSDEGDAQHRTVELNWRMRIKHKIDGTAQVSREQKLKCTLEKSGKKWKIVAMEPIEYFKP